MCYTNFNIVCLEKKGIFMKNNKKRKDNNGRILKKGESQRANLSYMYRWTDCCGGKKTIYAKSLDELRQKEEEISKELSVGVSRTSITLNEQIELYLELKVGLANSTKDNYWYYYKHSIKDSRIGNMKVIDLRKTDIMRFYKSLSDNDYSVGTIKIVHKIIHICPFRYITMLQRVILCSACLLIGKLVGIFSVKCIFRYYFLINSA